MENRVHRILSITLAMVVAFVLGMVVRSALPSQAMLMPANPVVVSALAKFNGPMTELIPGQVWIAGLAETSDADAAVLRMSSVKLHTHSKPNEFIYIVKGSANVQVGSIKALVKPGDFMFIPAGVPHSIQSIGSPVEFIGFQSPKMAAGDMHYVK
jgi:mannose-6-phosphate isomerase-like protein (cupin superfamily)